MNRFQFGVVGVLGVVTGTSVYFGTIVATYRYSGIPNVPYAVILHKSPVDSLLNLPRIVVLSLAATYVLRLNPIKQWQIGAALIAVLGLFAIDLSRECYGVWMSSLGYDLNFDLANAQWILDFAVRSIMEPLCWLLFVIAIIQVNKKAGR